MNSHLWQSVQPELYVLNNYSHIHDEDRDIINILAQYYSKLVSRRLKVLDVGTGPNLYPLLAILPFASRVDCLDVSLPNIRYLKQQVVHPDACWLDFLTYMYSIDTRYTQDLIRQLVSKVIIKKGSILQPLSSLYDIVTMFFCAEAISCSKEEFEYICRNFVGAAKPHGRVVAAFMENSCEYSVGAVKLSAYPVNSAILTDVFAPICNYIKIYHIAKAKNPLRDGYTGMLLLTGKKK